MKMVVVEVFDYLHDRTADYIANSVDYDLIFGDPDYVSRTRVRQSYCRRFWSSVDEFAATALFTGLVIRGDALCWSMSLPGVFMKGWIE